MLCERGDLGRCGGGEGGYGGGVVRGNGDVGKGEGVFGEFGLNIV